jgi:hypothetical protein
MHKLDRYGRVINKYGQEMRWNTGLPVCFYNPNSPVRYNPCVEIDYPEPVEKKDYKYVLIRR